MTKSLLLYMNLRSKQIVRLFAGIGPFRCLFLIGIAAILFYAFTKVTSVWVLPFYENNECMDIASMLSAYTLAVS